MQTRCPALTLSTFPGAVVIPHVSVPQRGPGIGAGSLPCLTRQDAVRGRTGCPETALSEGPSTHWAVSPWKHMEKNTVFQVYSRNNVLRVIPWVSASLPELQAPHMQNEEQGQFLLYLLRGDEDKCESRAYQSAAASPVHMA